MTDKVEVRASVLASVLGDVALFASTDQSRPVLCTVRVEVGGGRGLVVATDSYVLGSVGFDCDGSLPAVLVPVGDVKRIVALCKDAAKAGAGVTVASDGVTLDVVSQIGATLSCRLLDGQFPNYEQLFAGESTYAAVGAGLNVSAFDPALMFARLAKLRLGGKSAPVVSMALAGRLKPAVWYAEHDGLIFRGLSMPVRTETELAVIVAGPERISQPAALEVVG